MSRIIFFSLEDSFKTKGINNHSKINFDNQGFNKTSIGKTNIFALVLKHIIFIKWCTLKYV